jgi:iron complex outermembrane receptor protein
MRTALWHGIRLALALPLLMTASPSAIAQDEADPARPRGEAELETITVTAQKRVQSILEVPVTITAFTEADLERSTIRGFEDYAIRTPTVGFTRQGARGVTKVAIRGISNIGGKANSVGIYVDEFNIAPNILVTGYSRTADTGLYDVEQIEILRGPQGTYFGRNTMGGAISITTRKPDPGASAGSVGLEADDFGGWFARGLYNAPLGDDSALLVSAYNRDVGAFIDNDGPSGAGNSGSERGARLAFRFDRDGTTIDAALSRSRDAQDFPDFVPGGSLGTIPTQLVQVVTAWPNLFRPLTAPPINTAAFPEWPLPTRRTPFWPDNRGRHATDLPFETRSTTDLATLRVAHDLGSNLSLTSVTGWIRNDFRQAGDGDMSPYPAFFVSRDSDMTGFSQELRLSSFGNDRFDFVLGAIHARDRITETDLSTHLASDPYLTAWGALLFALGVQGGQISLADPQIRGALAAGLIPGIFAPRTVGNFEDVDRANRTRSNSLFGDLTWHLSESFDLSVGLRYTRDQVTFSEVTRPTITLPVGTDLQRGSFDNLSPRVALSWFADRNLTVFANAARGYKVGGFNSDVTAALPNVDKRFGAETGWNYELGLKSYLLDQRLMLNAALFRFDWKDLQVRSQDVLSQRQFVQNATDATSKGFEIELLARLSPAVDWRLAFGSLDATFGRFPNAITIDGRVIDATGNRIPQAPRTTFATGFDLNFPVGSLDGFARIDYSRIGDQFFDVENSALRRIDGYHRVDLRVGVSGQNWDAALFVRNLTDEAYVVGNQRLETFLTGIQYSLGAPRMIGTSFRYRF